MSLACSTRRRFIEKNNTTTPSSTSSHNTAMGFKPGVEWDDEPNAITTGSNGAAFCYALLRYVLCTRYGYTLDSLGSNHNEFLAKLTNIKQGTLTHNDVPIGQKVPSMSVNDYKVTFGNFLETTKRETINGHLSTDGVKQLIKTIAPYAIGKHTSTFNYSYIFRGGWPTKGKTKSMYFLMGEAHSDIEAEIYNKEYKHLTWPQFREVLENDATLRRKETVLDDYMSWPELEALMLSKKEYTDILLW